MYTYIRTYIKFINKYIALYWKYMIILAITLLIWGFVMKKVSRTLTYIISKRQLVA
jgi:hypothetical protein